MHGWSYISDGIECELKLAESKLNILNFHLLGGGSPSASHSVYTVHIFLSTMVPLKGGSSASLHLKSTFYLIGNQRALIKTK